MNVGAPHGRVTVETRRLWMLRASPACARWLLYGAAVVGIAATVRNAVSPPRGRVTVIVAPQRSDADGEWFALRFTQAYLSWSPDLTGHERALAPFIEPIADADGGLQPSPHGREQIRSVAIAGEHDGAAGERDYTVAAVTTAGVTRYLEVAVAAGHGGQVTLARYPALVDAPAALRAGALDGAGLPNLDAPALVATLDRALRNYLAASSENLAADLAPGALVAPVAPGLSLRRVQRLAVASADEVLATIVAADATGNTYTLGYRVWVEQSGGRWEITRIEP